MTMHLNPFNPSQTRGPVNKNSRALFFIILTVTIQTFKASIFFNNSLYRMSACDRAADAALENSSSEEFSMRMCITCFFRRVIERRLGVDGLAAKSILITQKVRVQRDPPPPQISHPYIYISFLPLTPFRQIRVKSHK